MPEAHSPAITTGIDIVDPSWHHVLSSIPIYAIPIYICSDVTTLMSPPCAKDNANAELPDLGGSAVLGSFVASGVRRRAGGEDPWLCGPGFRRVCLYRGVVSSEIRPGTGAVKRGSSRTAWARPDPLARRRQCTARSTPRRHWTPPGCSFRNAITSAPVENALAGTRGPAPRR